MTPRDECHLDTHRLGRRVLVYDTLCSTNTQAASFAGDPANDGLVILADQQTAGRGQHGRSWLCTPGAGVLMSVLLFPPSPLRRPAMLTAWAAVSVCETITELTGLDSQIKWPNDVLIDGRKVCGILIEQGRGTVVGIGVNVRQSAAELAELPSAGSLAFFTGSAFDTPTVARGLITHLDSDYHRLCQGDFQTLERLWQDRLGLLGQSVTAECHHGTYSGVLERVTWQALELMLPDGHGLRLIPEQVRHIGGLRSSLASPSG